MKKFTSLFFSVLSFTFLNAQEVPNNSFEAWEDFTFYMEPLDWNTGNQITYGFGAIGVVKSPDAYQGDFCAELQTIDVFNSVVLPGTLTLADFNLDMVNLTYSVSGGIPLHDRVTELDGMYKYQAVDGDSAAVLIYNFKNDGTGMDTIGYGYAYLHETGEWTSFKVNMEYQNDHIPDTLNIAFFSSGNAQELHIGSTLWVDSLVLHTYTGVFNLSAGQLPVSVYPNPATDYVIFETANNREQRVLEIYDQQGKRVGTSPFTGKKTKVNTGQLPDGIYFYKVFLNNETVAAGKFVKK